MSEIPEAVFLVFTRYNSSYEWVIETSHETRAEARKQETALREDSSLQVKICEFARSERDHPTRDPGSVYQIRLASWAGFRRALIVEQTETKIHFTIQSIPACLTHDEFARAIAAAAGGSFDRDHARRARG